MINGLKHGLGGLSENLAIFLFLGRPIVVGLSHSGAAGKALYHATLPNLVLETSAN